MYFITIVVVLLFTGVELKHEQNTSYGMGTSKKKGTTEKRGISFRKPTKAKSVPFKHCVFVIPHHFLVSMISERFVCAPVA